MIGQNNRRKTCVWLAWACALVCAVPAHAARDRDGYDPYYVESEKDKPWEEQAVPLPAYPAADAQWLDIYVRNGFPGQPQLLAGGTYIHTDNTVHYVLNRRSAQGLNNISAEALYCPTRAAKVFAYGDDVRRRWIPVRKSDWRVVGTTLNSLDAVRNVLYQTFCVDGLPRDEKALNERIHTRAMR